MGHRVEAVTDLVAGLREVEDALTRLRDANGRFYRSNFDGEQGILNSLRRERETTFLFKLKREIACQAPLFARMLSLAPSSASDSPLLEWIQLVNRHDFHLPDPAPVAANEGAAA